MVTQHHQLYDELVVQEVVAMGRLPYHSYGKRCRFMRCSLIWRKQLQQADQFMQDLSGGQQQRG